MQALHLSNNSGVVDSGQSVMTKLLADSLAGNSMTLMIGTLKQGEPSESGAVLKHMQVCRTYKQAASLLWHSSPCF
jgi:hypothetical protein